MKRVLIVFGTRPEAIKLCPLVLELAKHRDLFKTTVCVTGQHREMLDQVLDVFSVTPDIDLDLMTTGQGLHEITSRTLDRLSHIVGRTRPDVVVVQGDTTTTFGASLAAYFHKIPVVHVEAGLRTGDKHAPFPEEVLRRLTTVIADLHCAATARNQATLIAEGVASERIVVTGNTVIDALLWVSKKIARSGTAYPELSDIDLHKRIILVTGHRRENCGPRLLEICRGLRIIANRHPEVEIVYPVHRNPRVTGPVHEELASISSIKLIAPLSYEPFVHLMNCCHFIISDSGGIQEEAPSIGKPVLITRDTTERQEAVDAGAAKLVGTSAETIASEAEALLCDPVAYRRASQSGSPFGDGHASERIVVALAHFLGDAVAATPRQ